MKTAMPRGRSAKGVTLRRASCRYEGSITIMMSSGIPTLRAHLDDGLGIHHVPEGCLAQHPTVLRDHRLRREHVIYA